MSKLYIVPTPSGNLKDITFRAVEILGNVGFILAEDTRQTKKLLNHYSIGTPLRPHHQHNEHQVVKGTVKEMLEKDIEVAMVTDAGMPGISDPGYLMVKSCRGAGVPVECLPGATAFVNALVESGLPASTFCFEGFLPHQKGRAKKLKQLIDETRTMVFYESPYRLLKTLEQFEGYFGEERQASVSRELTKIHAETVTGNLSFLKGHFSNRPIKGEFVIVVHGKG